MFCSDDSYDYNYENSHLLQCRRQVRGPVCLISASAVRGAVLNHKISNPSIPSVDHRSEHCLLTKHNITKLHQ